MGRRNNWGRDYRDGVILQDIEAVLSNDGVGSMAIVLAFLSIETDPIDYQAEGRRNAIWILQSTRASWCSQRQLVD
jgi:hypothetical protein